MDNTLIKRLEERIEGKSLLLHPYYQAWQAGELTIEDLQIYAEQYYFFEANFPRYLSAIHSKCEDREVRQSILDNLWDEEHGDYNHRAMWLDFCAGLGLDKSKVEYSEIMPSTQNLLDIYSNTCDKGTFQEGLAVMYAYEAQVPEIALDKMNGLKEFYGLDNPSSLKFFEVHSILDEDHSDKEAEAIANTSDDCGSEVEMALQSALEAWWGFLDGMEEKRQTLMHAAD